MSYNDKKEIVNLNFGAIEVHVHNHPPGHDRLLFDVLGEFWLSQSFPGNKLEGFKVAYQLKDSKGLKLKLQGKSAHGNPVDFKNEDIDTTSSDPTILKVTEEDGFISVEPVGPLGTAQVQVSVPGVLHNGTPLSGSFDVQVIAGDAVSLAFEPSETFDLPDPNAPTDPNAPAGGGTSAPAGT